MGEGPKRMKLCEKDFNMSPSGIETNNTATSKRNLRSVPLGSLSKPSISGQILKWLSVLWERNARISAQRKEGIEGMNAEKHCWGNSTKDSHSVKM